ncbi:MAG: 4a-hydroxytetrahydrobiopterin dehydratase [Microlunatus sp.]
MTDPTDDPRRTLSAAEIATAGLADWRHFPGVIRARFRTGDFTTGLSLVNHIGAAAEKANHHPDLMLTYPAVTVTLSSHDVGGITSRDLNLARRVSELATELGCRPDPASLVVVELGLDTWAPPEVRPFLTALLGGSRDDREVVDPEGMAPTIWFQETEEHERPRQRWHLDVWVPPEQGQARVEAVVAAGGRLVDDAAAPSFWVLEDAQGNRACVCTSADRT